MNGNGWIGMEIGVDVWKELLGVGLEGGCGDDGEDKL